MSSGSTKPPKAPDPQTIIDAQTRANRVNQIGPYGSSTYSTDENGQATQTNQLSPELQAVYQRMLGMSAEKPQQAQMYKPPEGFDQLTSAIGGKVGQRYGLDSGSAKPSQQPMQKPMEMGSGQNRSGQANAALAALMQRQSGG